MTMVYQPYFYRSSVVVYESLDAPIFATYLPLFAIESIILSVLG